MEASLSTREKLLRNARLLFWSRGYSNVSVREVASAAGVDVALISRYFSGKYGLFEKTLEGTFTLDGLEGLSEDGLVNFFLRIFNEIPRNTPDPSLIRMLLTNAHDEMVGELVRGTFRDTLFAQLVEITGSEERAALFVAALLGLSVAEKSLRLPGIGTPEKPDYEAQLVHMMRAALTFPKTKA